MTGSDLPATVPPAGLYQSFRRSRDALHISGQVPWDGGKLRAVGRLGASVSTAEGAACAHQAALNALAIAVDVAKETGLVHAVAMRVYLATTEDFTDHVAVADGASRALLAVLGETGAHSRTTIGVASLPLGSPVEVELTFEIARTGVRA